MFRNITPVRRRPLTGAGNAPARPRPDGSEAQYLTLLGDGRVVFAAFTDAHGCEPWITDGTRTGTLLLRDINRGGESSHSYARDFTVLGRFPGDHALAHARAEAKAGLSAD